MKNNIIASLAAISLIVLINSCDEKLDIPPLNILTSDQIFQSQSGILAYLVSLYDVLPTEDHRFTGADAQIMNSTDESMAWHAEQYSINGTELFKLGIIHIKIK
jgi:hypothetical protein